MGLRLRTLFFILGARLLGFMPLLMGSGPPTVGDAITGQVDEQAKGSNQEAVLLHEAVLPLASIQLLSLGSFLSSCFG